MSAGKRNYHHYRQWNNGRRNRSGIPPQKGILWFYLVLCVTLLGCIVYMQWRMGNLMELQNKLEDFLTQSGKQQMQQEPEETMEALTSVRVVLLENDTDIYRENVSVTGDLGCVVSDGTQQRDVGAEDTVSFSKEAFSGTAGVTEIMPKQGGCLYVISSDGSRSKAGYQGKIEVWQDANGCAVVNEVSTDAYLAGVLPSEMPESYGLEALKAQAVCARSYLYAQTREEHYPQFHAHLDDTVSYQVYNHQKSGALSVQAVNETDSQVLINQGQIVETLYYSTSCGFSQSGSIFENASPVFQSVYVGNGDAPTDFENYIRSWDENALEKNEKYFRWVAVVDTVNRAGQLIDAIVDQQKKDPEDIVYSSELKKRISDENTKSALEAFGEIKECNILHRNVGGVAEQIEIVFEYGKVQVAGELHIRDILGAALASVQLQNGEIVTGITRLYSAAFVPEKKEGQWILYGGGCGHGVGMSQNGAKALAQEGYGYQDILSFFYQNTEIACLPRE